MVFILGYDTEIGLNNLSLYVDCKADLYELQCVDNYVKIIINYTFFIVALYPRIYILNSYPFMNF